MSQDLKFVLHQGNYVAQRIAGHDELLRPDVTAVHRMLKNDAVAATGWRAYALLSTAAAEHLAVSPEEGRRLSLEYEDVGRVEALVLRLDETA